jgi:hypothetical protein
VSGDSGSPTPGATVRKIGELDGYAYELREDPRHEDHLYLVRTQGGLVECTTKSHSLSRGFTVDSISLADVRDVVFEWAPLPASPVRRSVPFGKPRADSRPIIDVPNVTVLSPCDNHRDKTGRVDNRSGARLCETCAPYLWRAA